MRYVVVDLEMCNVPKLYRKGYRYSQETIQIGAVLLNENFEVTDSFMTYVKPEFGMITTPIAKLTRITSKEVAKAPKMGESLKRFSEWIPEDAVMVSWSRSDQYQIRHELDCKKIEFEGVSKLTDEREWIDCQETFSSIIKRTKRYNLVEAMNLSDIDYDEAVHDGLVDAKNTALLFRKMMTEKEYKFSKYYQMIVDQEDELIGA